jgi:hypothetical protein
MAWQGFKIINDGSYLGPVMFPVNRKTRNRMDGGFPAKQPPPQVIQAGPQRSYNRDIGNNGMPGILFVFF